MRTRHEFYRFTVKILVLVMALQGLPLMDISRAWQWDPQTFSRRLGRIVDFLGPESAQAAEQGIFGPKKYLRTTGAPDVYIDSFAAVSGPGTLVIRNGEPDSAHRVTSALIFVNGVQIYEPKDFKQDVYVLDLPLDLAAVNDLKVELRSKPGTYLTIEFTQAPPEVTLAAEPVKIRLGDSTQLTWNSTMAAACDLSPDVGPVDLNGSLSLSPQGTTTYTVTATAPAGTATASALVTVIPPPIVQFTADPQTIIEDDTTTLTWTSEYADTVSIEPGIGPVDVNGTLSVSPKETTTYTLTAVGWSGVTNSELTVTVIPRPRATLSVIPEIISEGESATLEWTSENAESVFIDNGIGDVEIKGAILISPLETKTYTLTAEGPGGIIVKSITLSVKHPPSLHFVEPDGADDNTDESFLIVWEDWDSDSNASISLYYDTDNMGADGVLVADAIGEDADGDNDQYLWDTSSIPEGVYYLYAVIDDNDNPAVIVYSEKTVSVSHTSASEISETKITADEGSSFDYFGSAVDISGNNMIVGAYGNSAVYIFEKADSGWQQTLNVNSSSPGDDFGNSVSIDGDWIVVGASTREINYVSYGAVEIYKKYPKDSFHPNGWSYNSTLTADDREGSDYFGCSVDIQGEYAVIGAYGDDDGGYNSGAAYIFKFDGSGWVQQQKLKAAEPQNYSYFGSQVAISDDYVVIGAYGDNDFGSYAGAAYIFKRESEGWRQQVKISAPDAAAWQSFGAAVDIGAQSAVIGAGGDQEMGYFAGAVYVYKKINDNWEFEDKLMAADVTPQAYFGCAVRIDNDQMIVGTQEKGETSSWFDSRGAAYIFIHDGSTWIEEKKIIASDIEDTDAFGISVAVDNGIFVVGSYFDDDKGENAGAAYIYAQSARVELSASPQVIENGDSATLEWNSQNAYACTIEPDIGVVPTGGSITVSPSETTSYTITAYGMAGNAQSAVSVEVTPPTSLKLTSFEDGAHIDASAMIIEGLIPTDMVGDVGVTVNGKIASLDGYQFVVNDIELSEGENTIMVVMADRDGNLTILEKTLYATKTSNPLTLRPDKSCGVPPFDTTLFLEYLVDTFDSTLTYQGPGTVEYLEEGDTRYRVRIETPGIYYFTANVYNVEATTTITAMDRDQFDLMIKTNWNAMKTSLISGDIENALSFFKTGSVVRYQQLFNALGSRLPQIVSEMNDIDLIYAEGNIAKYQIARHQIINGQPMDLTYYIYFMKDYNGLWGIDGF